MGIKLKNKKNISKIIIIFCLVIIISSIFFLLKYLQYRSFFSYEWEDEARFNQAVFNISQHFYPYQTIQDSTPKPTAFLNDHFSPFYFILALMYKIHPNIITLFFLVSFFTFFSAIPVYLVSKKILNNELNSFLITIIYLLYTPLHYLVLGTISIQIFSLPLLSLLIYFLLIGRFLPYFILLVLTSFIREDISILLLFFGLYQYLKKYPKLFWKTTIIYTLIYSILAIFISSQACRIPGFSSGINNNTFSPDYIDIKTIYNVFINFFSSDNKIYSIIFSTTKIKFFLFPLYSLLFIPLLSVELLIPLVVYLETLLAPGFFNNNSYYYAPIIPFLFLAFIYGIKKIQKSKKLLQLLFVIILINITNIFINNLIGTSKFALNENYHYKKNKELEFHMDKRFTDVKNIFNKKIYTLDQTDLLCWKIIETIPATASITCTGDLLPALSSRKKVYELGLNHQFASDNLFYFKKTTYDNYKSTYILINKNCLINNLSGRYAYLPQPYLDMEITNLQTKYNYRIVTTNASFVLLKKTTD